jgi:hypothetical protein
MLSRTLARNYECVQADLRVRILNRSTIQYELAKLHVPLPERMHISTNI